jgi:hypothetical protein
MPYRSRIRTLLALLLGGCLFVPAVTMPLLEVTVSVRPTQLPALVLPVGPRKEGQHPSRLRPFFKGLGEGLSGPEGTRTVWQKQRSIVGIIGELWRHDHFFVACAIVVFSLLVPIGKMTLLASYAVSPRPMTATTEKWLHLLHKHQQVEPLIAATLVAFLSLNAAEHPSGAFYFSSSLKSGFYLYVGYFLSSIYANVTVTGCGSADTTQGCTPSRRP